MRGLLILVILGLGAWFGGRALGWFGGGADHNAETKASETPPTTRKPEKDESRPAQPPKPTIEPNDAQSAAARSRAKAEADAMAVSDAVKALVAAQPIDRARLAQVASDSGDPSTTAAARAAIDSTSADAFARWVALSRLYASGKGDVASRAKLYASILEANAGAFRAAGARDSAIEYTVAAGDALAKICDRFRKEQQIFLTPGLLKWVNGLRSDLIRVGQKLKIPKEPVSIEVSKGAFRLRLMLGAGLVREYGVAIGMENRTPAGVYIVRHTLVKAPWLDPVSKQLIHFGEPGYAIGTRWIGFEDTADASGLGIHGTNEPDSIGTAASLGCIRMRNENVEELFDLVPSETKVTVIDATWPGY